MQLYTEGFGFAEAGGKVLWGTRVAQIQGLGDDAAFILWWLVGRQDLVQLEFFHHTTPPQRAVADRAPNDLGWSRFGITVPDFDAALERLAGLGVEPLSEPLAHEGLRRACFRDPYTGALVEVLEEGAATPGGIRPRFYDLVPAVVYATINVPDLAEARRVLRRHARPRRRSRETVLHPPELEALWGLAGAEREGFVARGGDVYLEVVRYDEPAGRPLPDDYLLSDRGFMNVALGFREAAALAAAYERVVANGYRDNFRRPGSRAAPIVNDAQGNTVELLLASRELDPRFGFAPQPLFRRTPAWPQPSVGPGPPLIGGHRWHASPPHRTSRSSRSSAPTPRSASASTRSAPRSPSSTSSSAAPCARSGCCPTASSSSSGSASPSGTSAAAAWRSATRRRSTTASPRGSSARSSGRRRRTT